MKEFVIALAYFNNPAMLEEHLQVLDHYPDELRRRTRLIVVDDASETYPATDIMQSAQSAVDYTIELYRIQEPMPWSQLRARNLGMHTAPRDSWVLATDIDHIVPAEAAASLIGFKRRRNHYYIPHRRRADDPSIEIKPHPNTYYMNREWFWSAVGGCDEDFVGWYGSDSIFRAQAARHGVRIELPHVELVVYNLGGEDIGGVEGAATVGLGRKESEFHIRSNPEMRAKLKRACQRGRPKNPLRFTWSRVL